MVEINEHFKLYDLVVMSKVPVRGKLDVLKIIDIDTSGIPYLYTVISLQGHNAVKIVPEFMLTEYKDKFSPASKTYKSIW